MANISMTVYYTQKFKEFTAEPKEFAKMAIREVNNSFKKSGILASFYLRCIEQTDITETTDIIEMFNAIAGSKSKYSTYDIIVQTSICHM